MQLKRGSRDSKGRHFRRLKRIGTRAMTLLEVTLVIGILLSFVVVLIFGFTGYKKGKDRAICIQNIAQVQRAVRSYCNLYDSDPGDTITGLHGLIVGPGRFLEDSPECPADGTYTFQGDQVPIAGVLYMTCDVDGHVPLSYGAW